MYMYIHIRGWALACMGVWRVQRSRNPRTHRCIPFSLCVARFACTPSSLAVRADGELLRQERGKAEEADGE